MKIEKLNENKIKIIFNYKELEENNISVHSFLSNSIESQKLFWAILDIAHEDLGFDISNSKISYETLSYDNKNFVIYVTKNIDSSFSFSENDLLNFQRNNIPNVLLYKFENINDIFSFCDFIKKVFSPINFNSSLHKYNDSYFIKIDAQNLNFNKKKKLIYTLIEFNDYLKVSNLSLLRFEEFSEILIKDNAIQNL